MNPKLVSPFGVTKNHSVGSFFWGGEGKKGRLKISFSALDHLCENAFSTSPKAEEYLGTFDADRRRHRIQAESVSFGVQDGRPAATAAAAPAAVAATVAHRRGHLPSAPG